MLAFAPPAVSESCPLGTKQVGEREEDKGKVIVVHPQCQRMSVRELDGQLNQLGGRIATTRASLARLAMRGGNLQADIDEWIKLSDDARSEAHTQVMSALASLGLRWLDGRVDAREAAALRQENRLLGVWPNIDGSPLQRLRASVLDQLRQAINDQDVLRTIKMASTVSGVTLAVGGAYIAPKDLNKWLMAGVALVQPWVNEPVLKLALVDARLGIPVLYGWTVAYHENIALNEITQLGEGQYKESSTLTQLYMKEIDQRNELLKMRVEREAPQSR